jgi:hypothetical protein
MKADPANISLFPERSRQSVASTQTGIVTSNDPVNLPGSTTHTTGQAHQLVSCSKSNRPRGSPVPDAGINGVITDQKLVEWYCTRQGWDATPIATDEFIGKSKDEYNSAWLSREIVQNFVDHNPTEPGTLNGVSVTEQETDGITRFVIKGDWTITKPTGLVGLQSKKPDGQNTAGGNGIGLKQVAVRLLRDFDVRRFQIQGATWNLDYDLINKKDINADLQAASRSEEVEDDWLIGKMSSCPEREDCSYIIDTQDPELISALRKLKEVGVCTENPYLDETKASSVFAKEGRGKLYWLPLNENGEMQDGRLFINGQVMSYRKKGESLKDYWGTSEGLTIQFDNMKYEMNIDRPPVDPFILQKYLDHILKDASPAELISQLKASEHIWAGKALNNSSTNLSAASRVIDKLVSQLRFHRDYDSGQYEAQFGDKKYLAGEIGIPKDQIERLESEGYIICPSNFAGIGMPKVSSALGEFDQAANAKPTYNLGGSRELAQKHGIRVTHQDLSHLDTGETFFQDIRNKLDPSLIRVERLGDVDSNQFRIFLNSDITVDDIFTDDLACQNDIEVRQSTAGQNLLHYLRGTFFHGISNLYFESATLSQGKYVVNHDVRHTANRKRLMARNIECGNQQGLFVDLKVSEWYLDDFNKIINGSKTAETHLTVNPEIQMQRGKVKVVDILFDEGEGSTGIYQPLNSSNPLDDDILNQLRAVDISAGDDGKLTVNGSAVTKERKLTDEQRKAVLILETKVPGISKALKELDQLIPEAQNPTSDTSPELKEYSKWRDSDSFYGQLVFDSQYLSPRSLTEIINEATDAKVDFVQASGDSEPDSAGKLNMALLTLINRLGSFDAVVQDDFEIITKPNTEQLAKLTLLKNYVAYTTGYAIPNDLFIYDGTGSYGINIGQKAIGLNSALLDTPFAEAVGTLFHEVAHNRSMAHDLDFRNALEKLITTERKSLGGIIGKAVTQLPLSPSENIVASIRNQWEKLSQ